MVGAVGSSTGLELLPCPYLRARGSYRRGHASRDHVCEAAGPAVRVRGPRQAGVCLAPRHADCPTYVAAQGMEDRRPEALDRGWRHVVATTPTVIVGPSVADLPDAPGESVAGAVRGLIDSPAVHRVTVGILAILAVSLFLLAEVIPRFTGWPAAHVSSPSPGATVAPSSPNATPSSAAAATPARTATPITSPSNPVISPTPKPTAKPTPKPTAKPTPKPTIRPYRQYTIQPGDTLGAIARRFGVSVSAIMELNGISDPRMIWGGYTLKIPW